MYVVANLVSTYRRGAPRVSGGHFAPRRTLKYPVCGGCGVKFRGKSVGAATTMQQLHAERFSSRVMTATASVVFEIGARSIGCAPGLSSGFPNGSATRPTALGGCRSVGLSECR